MALTSGQRLKATGDNTAATDGIKIYRALLTQGGTSAPVATVLENTLGGTLVWSRVSAGVYKGTLADTFTASKTLCRVGTVAAYSGSIGIADFFGVTNDNDIVNLYTYDVQTDGSNAYADDELGNTWVEIMVYP